MSLTGEEQGELRSAARGLLAQRSSPEQVRAALVGRDGWDEALWDEVVGLGWASIPVEERFGGAGCGYADVAVVLHELGRAITPSPFVASVVLAQGALALAANDDLAGSLLPALVAGECRGAAALAGLGGSYEPGGLTTTWRREGGSLHLEGAAGFVLDADLADVLVVVARDAADPAGAPAVAAVDATAPGLRVERVPTVDETRRTFTAAFDDVVVPEDRLLCEPGPAARALADQVVALGAVATACDAAGVADRVLERTVAYAKEREQFGKPIGSFQAVKHHCADMAIAVEASRAATRAAAAALDEDPSGLATAAATVASYVGPACSRVAALGLLVHGGIGFTWEHDAHLYLKRTKLDEVLFGTPSWHRRRLADAAFPALAAP